MTVMLQRQLNEDEKQRFLQSTARCWATGMEIPEDQPLHFDHIHAFARGGASELDNIAPMCGDCNRQKGTLSLENFRVKLRLQKFFRGGDTLTLGDLLRHMKEQGDIVGFGSAIEIHEEDGAVIVKSITIPSSMTFTPAPQPAGKYFYATFPVTMIDSDDDRDKNIGLQPRYLIFDKVFELFRHFQRHPVLQPSIGRIVGNRIRLFDGQHKIAGLLWCGRRDFECKIYVNPEIRLLNQTNISAHDKFAQTRFFSSIMVLKLGSQFGADFEEYKTLDDGTAKSEAGFMKWLERKEGDGIARGDLNKRFRSYSTTLSLRTRKIVSASLFPPATRSTDEKPITMDQFE